jgi:hypothetical protein
MNPAPVLDVETMMFSFPSAASISEWKTTSDKVLAGFSECTMSFEETSDGRKIGMLTSFSNITETTVRCI